ncbi:MAG: glycine zipper 2TM domain-containing protein [Gemmobacter sp.]
MTTPFRILAAAAISLAATAAATGAVADTYTVSARVTAVEPIHITSRVEEPVRRCRDVEEPVYGTVRGGSSGDVLAGALIGGAIGNQFGNGSGKDAMTVLGAILGADTATRQPRQVVTGYRTSRVCETVFEARERREVGGWRVFYDWNGLRGETETASRYRVGERIEVQVTLR